MFKGWFTDAVASTFVVAVILAAIGGLCAFLLRRTAKEASFAPEADAPAGPAEDVAVAQVGNASRSPSVAIQGDAVGGGE